MPSWVRSRIVEAAQHLAEERSAEEEESNIVISGLQILKGIFSVGQETWELRTQEALDLFDGEVPGIETKAKAQTLLRRFGFRSKPSRIGKHVLRSYQILQRHLEKPFERYRLKREVASASSGCGGTARPR